MIKKTIHYCWFGGAPFNDLILKCINSWHEKLPDFELKLWNENNISLDHPFVKKMYEEKNWAFVADYIRLFALYNEGGIYLDTDMEILKDLNYFLKDKCFLGFESPKHLAAGIIGSEKEHPFIGQCLEAYDDLREPVNIPLIITYILKTNGLNTYGRQVIGDVSLYECEVFYPWKSGTKFDENMVTDESFSIHHWHNSWKPSFLERVKRRVKRLNKKNDHLWKSKINN